MLLHKYKLLNHWQKNEKVKVSLGGYNSVENERGFQTLSVEFFFHASFNTI